MRTKRKTSTTKKVQKEPLLEVRDLAVRFHTDIGEVKAVDGVSFHLNKGDTLAIVGESGSGKTVTALSIMRLVPMPPGRIIRGTVDFRGRDLLAVSEKEMRAVRGCKIAMIFQDPMTSLNPVFTIGNQISEVVRLHQPGIAREQAQRKTIELLEMVGIPQAAERLRDYPHQFSGGMRQRVMIAMALSCSPDLLIADEPTTALDVTIEAQILEIIKNAKEVTGSSVILITHNLGIIARIAERVIVMYAGKVVEYADVSTIYHKSRHPYTLGLMNSLTRIDEEKKERLKPINGLPPSLINLPLGCSFSPRCEYAKPICFGVEPKLDSISLGHASACHFARVLKLDRMEH